MNNQEIKKAVKFVGLKVIGALIFVAVAGTSIWALAAFTEPTTGPSSSIQDFAKNIMGANNSDNNFDSSSVTANGDGSVIERLESLEAQVGATALSAESGSGMIHATAATYCRDLSTTAEIAINGSNTSMTYNDWKLGTIEEMAVFEGATTSVNYIWTATPKDATSYWRNLRLSDGYANYSTGATSNYVRCVR